MFEGRKVSGSQLKLTGSTDGKLGSLDYDEEVYLFVKGRVKKITHGDVTIGGTATFSRLHTVGAISIYVVEPEQGERMLDEAAMMADERFGIGSLFGGAGESAGDDSDGGGDS